jgi:hypothetical protein
MLYFNYKFIIIIIKAAADKAASEAKAAADIKAA